MWRRFLEIKQNPLTEYLVTNQSNNCENFANKFNKNVKVVVLFYQKESSALSLWKCTSSQKYNRKGDVGQINFLIIATTPSFFLYLIIWNFHLFRGTPERSSTVWKFWCEESNNIYSHKTYSWVTSTRVSFTKGSSSGRTTN